MNGTGRAEAAHGRDTNPAADPPHPGDRWRITGPVLTVLVLGLAAWVRATNFVGICRLDMFRYLELSNHVLSGGSLFSENVFYASSRLPLIGPLLASNAVFGWGEWASVGWPFACSLGTVLVTILLGRELWGWRVGLVAGLMTAIIPIQVELGTQLLPDPIQAFFTVLAIYCAVRAVTRDGDRWHGWALAAGFALGLAYLTRVNAIVFLPGVLAVGAILRPDRWKRSLWALAGLVGALAAAAFVFFLLTGDPFIDWRRTAEFYSGYRDTGFHTQDSSFFELMLTTPSLVWVPYLMVIGTIYAAIDRQRRSLLMLVWAFGFWFYLDVVSGWHGLDDSYRYAEPLVVPAILLASAAFARPVELRKPILYALGSGLALVVVLSSMHSLTPDAVKQFTGNTRWTAVRAVADTLEREQPATVWVTERWDLYALNYYSGFAFDRDTLSSPDADVNASARLFFTDETPYPAEPGTFLVTADPVEEEHFEFVDGFEQRYETLAIWRRLATPE